MTKTKDVIWPAKMGVQEATRDGTFMEKIWQEDDDDDDDDDDYKTWYIHLNYDKIWQQMKNYDKPW